MNVWIKFIPFINKIWKKRVFIIFSSTWKYMESTELSENFSFVEISYEYVMVAQLKEIYKPNTTASSMFFLGGGQGQILNTTYYKRSL